jgi:uncharacterized membrane protein
MPFTGIELLAVGVAFAIYARHAVDYERIRLFPHRLVIERMDAERFTQIEFNRAGCGSSRVRRHAIRFDWYRAGRPS